MTQSGIQQNRFVVGILAKSGVHEIQKSYTCQIGMWLGADIIETSEKYCNAFWFEPLGRSFGEVGV